MEVPLELCLTNAGPYVRQNALERTLREGGVRFRAVYKNTQDAVGFVLFGSQEDFDAALVTLPTLKTKSRALVIKPVTGSSRFTDAQRRGEAAPPPQHRVVPREGGGGGGGGGDVSVHDVVTPWHGVPYPQQLADKTAEMGDVLRAIALRLRTHVLRRDANLKHIKRAERAANARLAGHKRPRPRDDDGGGAEEGRAADGGAAAAAAAGAAAEEDDADEDGAAGADADAGDAGASSASSSAAATTAESDQPAASGSSAGANNNNAANRSRHRPADVTTGLTPEQVARLPGWLRSQPAANDGMVCPLYAMAPAPLTHGYRNKASFTIGWDAAGAPCVGSRTTSFADGVAVAPPDGSVHLPEQVTAVVAAVTRWLRSSPLPPYQLVQHTGVWRTLTVRWAATTRQCMVILLAKPPAAAAPPVAAAAEATGADAAAAAADTPASEVPPSAAAPAEDQMAVYRAEIARFVQLLTTAAAAPVEDGAAESSSSSSSPSSAAPPVPPLLVPAASVYLQEHSGVSQPPPNTPHQLLAGAPVITEAMCGLRFNISPGAFFQVNTPAAEVLYSLVKALALRGKDALADRPLAGDAPAAAAAAATASETETSSSSSAAATAAVAAPAPITDAPAAAAPAAGGTAIVDVCCGTGTIGLVCATDAAVGRVVGVELSAEAIADAKANAALNGIPPSRATWVCARAEAVMRDILDTATAPAPAMAAVAAAGGAGAGGSAAADGGDAAPASSSSSSSAAAAAPAPAITRVTAIVDPPRSGLHATVIKALRTCRSLKRLVYVSCAPTGSFLDDAVKLCAPQEDNSAFARGPPLRPVAAVPVDLFPHTPHSELVVLFERD